MTKKETKRQGLHAGVSPKVLTGEGWRRQIIAKYGKPPRSPQGSSKGR